MSIRNKRVEKNWREKYRINEYRYSLIIKKRNSSSNNRFKSAVGKRPYAWSLTEKFKYLYI
jgi:hypothetical protein